MGCRASCVHLAGDGRLQALPQPVLQGVEPDEHAIGWEQAVWAPLIVRPLLVVLRRVDENQARWCSRAGLVTGDRVRGE